MFILFWVLWWDLFIFLINLRFHFCVDVFSCILFARRGFLINSCAQHSMSFCAQFSFLFDGFQFTFFPFVARPSIKLLSITYPMSHKIYLNRVIIDQAIQPIFNSNTLVDHERSERLGLINHHETRKLNKAIGPSLDFLSTCVRILSSRRSDHQTKLAEHGISIFGFCLFAIIASRERRKGRAIKRFFFGGMLNEGSSTSGSLASGLKQTWS